MEQSAFDQLKLMVRRKLTRVELNWVRSEVRPQLESHTIMVAAISGKEVESQELVLVYCGERYHVPVETFAKCEVWKVAHGVMRTHESTHKQPPYH